MREIKFRVWNGEYMVSPDNIDRTGTAWWYENSIPQTSKNLMQFTGLRDKNGEEIYEGDICLVPYIGHKSSKGVIEFRNGSFVFQSKEDPTQRVVGWQLISDGNIEVIGNIYENPELLD